MEPKVIKEEVVEKEPSTNYAENSGRTTRTSRGKQFNFNLLEPNVNLSDFLQFN